MDTQNLFESIYQISSAQMGALYPYLILCAGIFLCTLAAGFKWSLCVTKVVLWTTLVPFTALMFWTFRDPTQILFGTSFTVDALARMSGAMIGVFALLVVIFFNQNEAKTKFSEWSVILLVSTLGLSLLPTARDFPSFFIYLETGAIAGYILAAIESRKVGSLEAGFKYLMTGAFASAIFLMGVALVFGASGSLAFTQIAESINYSNPLFLVGFSMIVVSLSFKIALAPFHMWAPDVYKGAPTAMAAFLASATKVSVLAAFMVVSTSLKFLESNFLHSLILVLACFSILVGNIGAFGQRSLKKIFSFSSVANAGYAALALLVGASASASMMLYLGIYGVSVIAMFALLDQFSHTKGEVNEDVRESELISLSKASPLFVLAAFSILLFSMAGIPPMPGFLSKYLLLKDLWSSSQFIAASVMLFGSLLGIAYYLRLMVPVYMEAKDQAQASNFKTVYQGPALLALGLSLVLLLGILAGFSRTHDWMNFVEGFAR